MSITPNAMLSERIRNKLNQIAIIESEYSKKLLEPLMKKDSKAFHKEIKALEKDMKSELILAEKYGMDSYAKEQIEKIHNRILLSTNQHNDKLAKIEEIQRKATNQDIAAARFDVFDDFPPEKEPVKGKFVKEIAPLEILQEKEMVLAGIYSLNSSKEEVMSFSQKIQKMGKAVVKDASLACLEAIRKQERIFDLHKINVLTKSIRKYTEKQAKYVKKQTSQNPLRKLTRKLRGKEDVTLNQTYDSIIRKKGLKLSCIRTHYQSSLEESISAYEKSNQLRESLGMKSEQRHSVQNIKQEKENSPMLDSIIEKAQARYREICRPATEPSHSIDISR